MLAACAPDAPGVAPADTPGAAAEQTITVWWATTPTQQGVVNVFQTANPQITVELAELGEAVYGNPKYVTAVAAGTGPDVAYQNRHTFHQFAARKLYRPIDDLFTRDDMKKEDFPATQLEEVSWEGTLYGLPYVVDTRYFFYNRKHFEEVGLDPDVPPATWDDLIEFTQKLSVRNGSDIARYGFIPGFPAALSDQLLIFAIENGAKAYTPDFRTCLLDQPEWIEALEWVARFYKDYCDGFGVASGSMQGFASQAQDAFVQEKVSMSSYGSWMISSYAAFPDLDYAYAFARLRAPGENLLFMIVISTMMVPGVVTLVPLFILFARLRWVDTFLPLTIPVMLGGPFFIFLLRQFFLTLPEEMIEAAVVDGASHWRIWWKIAMPNATPALATAAVFSFIAAWNDFVTPLVFLNSRSKYTLALGLQVFLSEHGAEWGLLMAASTMVVFPIIVLFFFAQKQFIQGIALTGIKG